jgi:HPt (histidine-containing phosphotransfer) domain-containing protein
MSTAAGRSAPPGVALRAHAEDGDFSESTLLERLMNDREIARAIVQAFLEDIPKQIGVLKGFLDAGDAQGVELLAHTIRGAAAAVCGEGLMNVACELELVGRSGDLRTATASFAELRTRFERLKEAMKVSNLLDTTK